MGCLAPWRDLDSKDIPTIYARCPSGGGVTYGLVANRLKKAAGFHIVGGDKAP